jgi:hypothetical protein
VWIRCIVRRPHRYHDRQYRYGRRSRSHTYRSKQQHTNLAARIVLPASRNWAFVLIQENKRISSAPFMLRAFCFWVEIPLRPKLH